MLKKKNVGWIILAVVTLLSFLIVRAFIQNGEFQTIVAQSNYTCKAIEAPYGAGDLFADYDTGLLYISATPRHLCEYNPSVRGDIYVLNMDDNTYIIELASAKFNKSFKPHGISLIKLADGTKRLFVINHVSDSADAVEVFEVNGKKLNHIKTIGGFETGLNSLVAIDGERFYATQDGHTRGVSGFINGLFKLEYAEIVYYDGENLQMVADGFVYANGIEMTQDGNQVYVTDTAKRTLSFYDRDIVTNKLTKSGDIYLDAGGDNIRRNADGSFLIAGHPKNFSSYFYKNGLYDKAPSVVFNAIPPKDDKGGELHAVYLDDGTELSASSGAIRYKNKMYVGSVMDNKILSCVK